jgi:hypothetical protein
MPEVVVEPVLVVVELAIVADVELLAHPARKAPSPTAPIAVRA